ncbi:MAG TPA: ABC transporter permease [Bryobacteraceae bacterium]|jgi:putative ABC transport system permease protein|nr:ABC transporter permease [Bryobacteraceae bacterium]
MFWRKRKSREQDLERELRSDLELETAEQQENGLSADEARYAAQRAFGNTTLVKEAVLEMWGWTYVERFAQDIRYTGRLLRKNPGFAAVAIVTLAIGIGANTAIFSVMDAVLLRPLPYPDSNRLIRIWQGLPKMGEGHLGAAPPEFIAYRDRTRAFSSVAGYQPDSFDLTNEGEPEQISGYDATANLFPALQVQPLIGRTFTAQEELHGAEKVVVLSYQFWRRHYAEDAHVIGKIIRLNEQPYQIVGVMPKGFIFPSTAASPGEPPALWVPLRFTGDQLNDWASSFDTNIIGRLKDGISNRQARDDVKRVAAQFQQEHPNIYSGNVRLAATAELWSPEFGGHIRVVLPMLGAAVGFLLLIACANVANLLMARAGARQREMSIRKALGASTGRVTRQVLTETLILTLAGGAAGCALAFVLLHLMNTFSINEINIGAANIDIRVLLFTFLVCGGACLLCGVAPAWMFRSAGMHDTLEKSGRQSGQSRSNRHFAHSLIVAEIACCVVVLIGSGLLFRSFIRILEVPLGFDPNQTLIVRTTLNRQRFSSDRRHTVERTIQARLASLPGVSAIAVTTDVPLADQRQIGFGIDGQPPEESHWADNALVSCDYFRVMKIPLLRGRTFSEADTAALPLVAVVNQTMASQYWPKEDPIGKGFSWGGRHLTVIGVVGDVHVQALDKPLTPTIYNSVYQIESGASTSGVFLIRAHAGLDPMRLAASAQNVIWSVDRGLPILGFSTLEQVVSASLAIRRASLILVGSFALIALLLSLIGVYGVLSYTVARRTQEMGLRFAFGAKPIEIKSLVVRDGARLATWGILFGVAGGVFAARYISRLVFGIPALDPFSFLAGVLLLFAAALLASYIPARRASRIDPMVALRYE